MKVTLSIALLVFLTCLAYTAVGNLVPQKEEHPPPTTISTDDPIKLAEQGAQIYPGACEQCHGAPGTGGTERAPDLDGVATRLAERAEVRSKASGQPFTAEDYLLESLLDPGAYLVERAPGVPYGNIMSFKLSPTELLATAAYLQTLGGGATLTGSSEAWQKWGGDLEETAADGGGGSCEPIAQGPPAEIIKKYGCEGCHDFVGKKILPGGGPALSDIGARMSPGDILMQIVLPNSEIAKAPEGVTFPKGLMSQTLKGNGFFCDVGEKDLHGLVLWMAEKKKATP